MPILDNFHTQFINNASQSDHGMMSSHDKTKLDGISLDDIEYIKNGLDEINENNIPRFIYGIEIDPSNPDPRTCVEYTDDATGFDPLKVDKVSGICNYGSWKNIIINNFGIAPFLVNTRGEIVAELNPDNYNKTIDNKVIDIESGNLGQVMIRFKRLYYKFLVYNNKIWFRVSNKKIDNTWIDIAFVAEDGIGSNKDQMFISAYEAVQKNNILQSISNGLPSYKLEFDRIQDYSSFGVFHMMNISKKQFIMFLSYLVTKSIDLESNIGNGNISGPVLKTGTMNDKGLFYGTNDNMQGVKVFGIENLWGNQLKYMNGIVQKLVYVLNEDTGATNSEQHLYIKDFYPYNKIEDFNDVGKIQENTSGFIASLKFVSDHIYMPDKLNGSTSTYYKSYFANGVSKNANNKLYGIYGGNSKYYDKSGPEFLLLANLDPDIDQATTHLVY